MYKAELIAKLKKYKKIQAGFPASHHIERVLVAGVVIGEIKRSLSMGGQRHHIATLGWIHMRENMGAARQRLSQRAPYLTPCARP